MSIVNTWVSISADQHWVVEDDKIMGQAKSESNQSCIGRLILGNRSLACCLNTMSDQLSQLTADQMEKITNKELDSLSGILANRVHKYNKTHGCLYKLFMWIIGRSVFNAHLNLYTAYKKIRDLRDGPSPSQVASSDDLKSQASSKSVVDSASVKSQASCKSLIPVDRTCDLESLTNNPSYQVLAPQDQFNALSCYIHFLPLARHLQMPFNELSRLIVTKNYYLDYHDTYGTIALDIIRIKKGLIQEQSFKEIVHILVESNVANHTYHVTNLVALENILKNGLGSESRDYDVEAVRKMSSTSHHSGLETAAFYVAGKPHYSYGYANDSPEWLRYLSDADRSKFPQYNRHEVAIIQIRLPFTDTEKQQLIKEIFNVDSQYRDAILPGLVNRGDFNERIEGRNFNPINLVYYRVPKFSGLG